jgi:hypothetical protein
MIQNETKGAKKYLTIFLKVDAFYFFFFFLFCFVFFLSSLTLTRGGGYRFVRFDSVEPFLVG